MKHSLSSYTHLGCRCDTCKEEWNAYQRMWRQTNLEKARGIDVSNARSRRLRIYDLLADIKSKPCVDCRQTFPAECMDFDHIPGKGTKEFNIGVSAAKVSAKRLEAEIAKCEIVCANCHRTRTRSRKAKPSSSTLVLQLALPL